MQLSGEGPAGRLLAPLYSGVDGKDADLQLVDQNAPDSRCAGCWHSPHRAGLWGWCWVAARATHGLSVALDGWLHSPGEML